jgi:RNA polymerase sigma-70 factor (ECF subfamily)
VLSLALRDIDLAEDATQEAFARAYAKWHKVQSLDRPEAWIYVVAHNAARDVIRRRHHGDGVVDRGFQKSEEEAVLTHVDVARALDGLPIRQREVVVLRYLADLTTAETAKAMGCAEGTVRASLHAAMQALRDRMGSE